MRKKLFKILLLSSLLTVFFGCGIEYEDIEIRVSHYRALLDEEEFRAMSYFIKSQYNVDPEEWEEIKNDIKYFDFKWGYEYKLKVRRQERKPCENKIEGYTHEYKLIEILTKSYVDEDTTFELKIKKGDYNYIKYNSEVTKKYYTLPDGTKILYDNKEAHEDKLKKYYNKDDIGKKVVIGTFKHSFEGNNSDKEIILIDLREEDVE
ncbi:MAG: DUF4377 domain-containing protein [Fusobacteria bacterium]|nr:DUF4377 domain-containing protein [Fusobacteriota bacterium]